MSDFARFVAAALHDHALEDVQVENNGLRRELERLRALYESNPFRPIKLTGPGGAPVYADNILDFRDLQDEDGDIYLLGDQDHMTFPFKEFASMELWIDGRRVLRLQDLTLFYMDYNFIRHSQDDECEYRAVFFFEDEDLRLTFDMSLPPKAHAQLLGRESPVEFAGQIPVGEFECELEHDYNEISTLSRFMEFCSEQHVTPWLNCMSCSSEQWLIEQLTVPYVPTQND